MEMSGSGQLIEFTDYLAAYHIATTSINVSEADAINLSHPLAEAYAESNGLRIMSTHATLEWWRDYTLARSNDVFALYPIWSFKAEYNNTVQGVYGYEVLTWADSGKVLWNGTEAVLLGSPVGTPAPNHLLPYLLLGSVAAVVLIACLGTYLRRQKKRRISR